MIKTFKICSNPTCSPMARLGAGTILKRVTRIDKTTLKCKNCKAEYDAEIINMNDFYDGEHCPTCGGPMDFKRERALQCPKCKRWYS